MTISGIPGQVLAQYPANDGALTPLTFMERSAQVYPARDAVVYGRRRFTWSQVYTRCRRMASSLQHHSISAGDTVAVIAPNVPAIYEAHFGVPMAAAILNTMNIRLNAESTARILQHSSARALLVDEHFLPLVVTALQQLSDSEEPFEKPLLVVIADSEAGPLEDFDLSSLTPFVSKVIEYEDFLAEGNPEFEWIRPSNEWDAISLNYTSGTTSQPKGVLYAHRGTFINAMSIVLMMELSAGAVCVWTLPMFHCNGWCFPWVMAALGGTNICLRNVIAESVFEAIKVHRATLICGAPIVLNTLINGSKGMDMKFEHKVKILTGGAPPPSTVLAKMEEMGFDVTHSYGLTEVYGPALVCAWKEEWNSLPLEERAALKARQGVKMLGLTDVQVCDPKTMISVPADGKTIGEIMIKGHTVMKGYLRNEEATSEAFRGGFFHSGDLAIVHPDGYVEIKDRSKDIIISGGENISSIEVESALYKNEVVSEAAVVARPDEKWGESPCAFIALREDVKEGSVREEDIVSFCKGNLPHFMVPKTVIFGPLPKTSTGKIQKFLLRDRAKELGTLTSRL